MASFVIKNCICGFSVAQGMPESFSVPGSLNLEECDSIHLSGSVLWDGVFLKIRGTLESSLYQVRRSVRDVAFSVKCLWGRSVRFFRRTVTRLKSFRKNLHTGVKIILCRTNSFRLWFKRPRIVKMKSVFQKKTAECFPVKSFCSPGSSSAVFLYRETGCYKKIFALK